MKSGVHSSLHLNCHHHITFANPLLMNEKSGIIKRLMCVCVCVREREIPWDDRFANISVMLTHLIYSKPLKI